MLDPSPLASRAALLHTRDGHNAGRRRLDISVGAVKSRVFRARQTLSTSAASPIPKEMHDDHHATSFSSAAAVASPVGQRHQSSWTSS